jgi:hypothetical protein
VAGPVLDYQERVDLAMTPDHDSTRLLWHHPSSAFDAYKVRFGGGAHDDGFYIAGTNGSTGTEATGVAVAANEIVETIVALRDLLPNDAAEDGARTLRIYVRDAVTMEWTSFAESLAVPVNIWRGPPVVTADDFSEGVSTEVVLRADREFRVIPEVAAVPAGANHALDMTYEGASALLASADPVFEPHQDGFPGIPTALAFPPEIDLNQGGSASVKCLVIDAFGHIDLRLIELAIRDRSPFEDSRDFARVRFAIPPKLREKDPLLEPVFRPWDAVLYQLRKIAASVRDLIDAEKAPVEALRWMFQEVGLIYPDIPGYPEAALRRLLLNANEIHSRRYSVDGLKFYLELLIPGASVEIGGINRGVYIFLSTPGLGYPSLDDLLSAGTDNDTCPYLIGPNVDPQITITVTGNVSDELQEFVRSTIHREVLMADDPAAPAEIDVVFIGA